MPLSRDQYGLYFPDDLKPSRVPLIMVCGPPCGGKSTFVRSRAGKSDLIIDLDEIASKLAGSRAHGWDGRHLAPAVAVRNGLLRSLAKAKHPTAWFILGAPDERRQWWVDKLQPSRVVLIDPGVEACLRRLEADPERFQDRTARAIHQWYTTFVPRDDEELIGRLPFGAVDAPSELNTATPTSPQAARAQPISPDTTAS